MVNDVVNTFGKKPLVLVVDDVQKNLQVVGTTLMDEGYEISMANHGEKALKLLEKITPDLILLDVMMPDINGYQVCERIKQNGQLKNIPIIFLTAKTELDDIVNGFKLGAVDYVTKPFKKEELLVRIKTHLEVKFSRELIEQNAREIEEYNTRLKAINSELEESNRQIQELLSLLRSELDKASEYVQSLLPKPINKGSLQTDWMFVPSAELSGDSFGYHWIDEDNFAIYLLDVCGHGIGSALLSVSALNVIKFQTLPDCDFRIPEQVMNSLNKSFQMIDHNDSYFTIWYGVYNRQSGILKHCSAGHHEAVLVKENGEKALLLHNNVLIGLDPDTEYFSEEYELQSPARLFIFTDGAFEISHDGDKMWTKEEFIDLLASMPSDSEDELSRILSHVRAMHGSESLDDDFSMLKIKFL